MKTACVCLAAIPAAASAAQFVNPDDNLVLLQRHAEAKLKASGGTDEQIWPFDQLFGETHKVLDQTRSAFDQLLGRQKNVGEVSTAEMAELPNSEAQDVELSAADGEARTGEWNLCGAEVSNNLGGVGPDLGAPPEIRYKKVLTLPTGQEMDLVVTNSTEYSPKDLVKNGETGCFGRINIKAPGSLTMEFKLVATGTNDFVDDLVHDFTVMDLDHSKAGMMESITTSGFSGTPTSVITPIPAGDGISYTFEGLESSTAITDPRSPWNLTQPQKDASVGFKFAARQSWEVTYTTWDDTGGLSGGRNFLFTGLTSLQEPEPCGPRESMNTETGECEVYQDPHIDGFDNPRNGPFLTRISAWDMPKKQMSLLDGQNALKSWLHNGPPSIDVNEYERGDFWLVKNEQLSIQGRYNTSQEFPGGRSGLAALAIGGPILDGGVVTLEPKSGAITFFGKKIADVAEHKRETTTGLVSIKTYYDADAVVEDGVAPSGVDLTLPSGAFVHIRRYNTHLDAKIVVPRSYGLIDGQCGNWNGDATDDSLDAIMDRIGSTKVSRDEMLFAEPLLEEVALSGREDEWNFCQADISSNFAGLGPDFGAPPELRYKSVLTLSTGQELDLVVTNTSEYTPKDQHKNGETACFGRINVKSPGSLTMQFKLVAAGTNEFVSHSHHDFTVMDLDHSEAGMMESITTSGFVGTPTSVITPVLGADGKSTFKGLEASLAIPDPKSPWNLTQPQKDASVGFKFAGHQTWEVTYTTWDSTTDGLSGGRNFLFTGKTSLQDPHPCGPQGSMDMETGECEVYQDPHVDGFDNPRTGPFLTRISGLDMPKKHTSLLEAQHAWLSGPPSIDLSEYERGDFWLVKNKHLVIQARYGASLEFPGNRSGLAALAIGGPILDAGIVTIEPKVGVVSFFGKEVGDVAEYKHETSMGIVAIKTHRWINKEDGTGLKGVDVELPSGVFVHVRRYKTHLDAKIVMPKSLGATDGQCGNFNGDSSDDALEAITKRMHSTKVSSTESLFAKPPTGKVDVATRKGKCDDWCSAELFTKIEANTTKIKNLTSWSMKCEWFHCSECSACDGISGPILKKHQDSDATPPSLREHNTKPRCENWCSSTVFEVSHQNKTSTKQFFWDDKCAWRNCGGCPGCPTKQIN